MKEIVLNRELKLIELELKLVELGVSISSSSVFMSKTGSYVTDRLDGLARAFRFALNIDS